MEAAFRHKVANSSFISTHVANSIVVGQDEEESVSQSCELEKKAGPHYGVRLPRLQKVARQSSTRGCLIADPSEPPAARKRLPLPLAEVLMHLASLEPSSGWRNPTFTDRVDHVSTCPLEYRYESEKWSTQQSTKGIPLMMETDDKMPDAAQQKDRSSFPDSKDLLSATLPQPGRRRTKISHHARFGFYYGHDFDI
jgi:hypothetical protein